MCCIVHVRVFVKKMNSLKSVVLPVEPVLLPPLWIIDKGLVLHFAFSYFFHLIYSQTSGTNTLNSTSEFLGVGITLHGLTPQSPINQDRQSRNIFFWFCLNWDQPLAGLIGFLWFGFLCFLRFGFLCFLSFVFLCFLCFVFPVSCGSVSLLVKVLVGNVETRDLCC